MEAAFFDLDKTVIARASMVAFSKPLYRAGYISRWLLMRAIYGQLIYLMLGASEERLAQMRDSVMRLTKGWDQERIQAIVTETLEEVIEPIIYAEALKLIRDHQTAGRLVYIVSASPEEIVKPLAKFIGVEHVIATRAEIDADGKYNGKVEFYSYGPNKEVAMRAEAQRVGIDLDASYAYSDSATDIPMLNCVGHAVAVNPDRELLKAAKENGWEVQRFVEPVRVRVEEEASSFLPVLAAASALAGAGALAGTLVWQRRLPPPPPPSRYEIARRWLNDTARREPIRPTSPSWRQSLPALRR